jgi:hypothetical protein
MARASPLTPCPPELGNPQPPAGPSIMPLAWAKGFYEQNLTDSRFRAENAAAALDIGAVRHPCHK